MRLSVTNIGMFESASIDIDAITVIAGNNNTGKSTLSKALYSFFSALHNLDGQIYHERISGVERSISWVVSFEHGFDAAKSIVDEKEKILASRDFNNSIDSIVSEYSSSENLRQFEAGLSDEDYYRIKSILELPDVDIAHRIISRRISDEFGSQPVSLYAEDRSGEIGVTIKNEITSFLISDNQVSYSGELPNISTEAVYFDDPYVLDRAVVPYRFGRGAGHRSRLCRLVLNNKRSDVASEILVSRKLDTIVSKLNSVIPGRLSLDGKRRNVLQVTVDSEGTAVEIGNVSTGLKTFVILKGLLESGSIEDNGTIILDEPEIHLHPDWQILFAELIVLLQIEFGLHILINTHSPYFVEAIDTYSKKYGVREKCHFYLTERRGNCASCKKVDDSLEDVFARMLNAFQVLENEESSL